MIEFDSGLIEHLTEEELNQLADDPYYYVSTSDTEIRFRINNFIKKYTTDFEHGIKEMFVRE